MNFEIHNLFANRIEQISIYKRINNKYSHY